MIGVMLALNLIALVLVFLDALLIKKYYRAYYPSTKMHFEWKLIILGLILFPVLSKTGVIILHYYTGTKIASLLYALPSLSALMLCFGTFVLWRRFRL